jgi:hypothetical protein
VINIFLECLEALIACTGPRRISHLPGKVYTKGHKGYCSVVLEAVADYDLWIWHSLIGMTASHNDINVLQRSPIFARLVESHALP